MKDSWKVKSDRKTTKKTYADTECSEREEKIEFFE
jgi:hypothetical protein